VVASSAVGLAGSTAEVVEGVMARTCRLRCR
jgi:hypothetical protein